MFTDDQTMLINRIVEELEEDNVAIFAGAGLSVGAGHVNWKQLLTPLAKEIRVDIEKEHDLVSLAQYYINENGRQRLADKLINEVGIEKSPTENHKLLAKLPITNFWTTNYDALIEESLKKEGKLPDVKFTNDHLATTKKGRSAIVYKMHGDISLAHDAILTKDQYESYPIKHAPFVTALSGHLVSKTFLFLGFSFTDPNLDYILSRIRINFEDRQRQHFCIFKAVSSKDYKNVDEYNFNKVKQELLSKDLKRFNIKVILIEEWSDLNKILKEITNQYKSKSIFLSGSAHDYGQWTKDETENFLSKLGEILIRKKFKIVSGLGLGIGNAFISGGIKEIYSNQYGKIDDQIIMKPFPQHVPDPTERSSIWTKWRYDLIGRSGICLFFMGNKLAGDKIELANGMDEEFKIAKELGLKLIPIGCSGYKASEYYQEIIKNINDYYPGKSPEFIEKLKALNENVHKPEQLIEKILDVLKDLEL